MEPLGLEKRASGRESLELSFQGLRTLPMGSEDGRWQVQLLELGLSLCKSGSQEGWEVHHLLRSVIKLESWHTKTKILV